MIDGLLLTMMNPPEGGDAEFNDWVDTEHLPERKVIPGIRCAVRFRNKAPSPRYMAIYDLEDLSVLNSPAYAAIAGENLSPWSKRILAGASARWRFEGSRIGNTADATVTGGKGKLNELLLVRWRGIPGRFDEAIMDAVSAPIANMPGIVQLRVFAGQRDGRTDYVAVVESTEPIDAGAVDPAHFSAKSLTSDFANLFVPVEGR